GELPVAAGAVAQRPEDQRHPLVAEPPEHLLGGAGRDRRPVRDPALLLPLRGRPRGHERSSRCPGIFEVPTPDRSTRRHSVAAMTRIAVLGTGAVGAALAGALARAGHTVTAGSRDPARRAPGWGVPVPLAGLAEAAEGADVVVNATPGHESVDLLRPLAPQLAGRDHVDADHAVPPLTLRLQLAPCHPASRLPLTPP